MSIAGRNKLAHRFHNWCARASLPFARFALATIFIWFGALKLVAVSPANPLVADLLARTLPLVSFDQFILVLGGWEIAIGFAFLIPGFERLALFLLVPHLLVTTGPLILLPQIAWQKILTPTLEGQYIIKNLLIAATALFVAGQTNPSAPASRA